MNQRSQQGFTLLEVMIVVAIVAILTSIAVPAYSDYMTRSRLTEAYATLGSQRVRMEQYYQDQRTYTGACTDGTVAPRMVDTAQFRYTCTIADQTYTLTATGQGSTAGFVFTVDQNNARATRGAPSGWTVNNACWIRRKDGSC
jgi:type IV pilus assembly protein PilE